MRNWPVETSTSGYYEVISRAARTVEVKGILMDDSHGGADIRIDNREPPHDRCDPGHKKMVVQLAKIVSQALFSLGYVAEQDLAQLAGFEPFITA